MIGNSFCSNSVGIFNSIEKNSQELKIEVASSNGLISYDKSSGAVKSEFNYPSMNVIYSTDTTNIKNLKLIRNFKYQ